MINVKNRSAIIVTITCSLILWILATASGLKAATQSGAVASTGSFITSPTFGMPALWLRSSPEGSTITIDPSQADIDLSSLDESRWHILLRKANGPVRFETDLTLQKVEEISGGYLLHVTIPDDIPVDLFDLEISVESGTTAYTACQPNAVKTIDTLKDTYSIIHVTDIHVDDPRGCAGNCSETAYYKFIKKMIHAVNLINPEFVIITGDHVFGINYEREYSHLYEVLQEFDVPILMAIGNHDAINHAYHRGKRGVDGLRVFEKLFAPLTFTFTYGGLEYISLNSMDWSATERLGLSIATIHFGGQMQDEQLDWFKEKVSQTDAALILAGYHHPPHNSFQGTGADRVMQIARDYDVNAVLTGHTHQDEVRRDDNILYITTSSVLFNAFGDSYPAFRILDIADDELVSWNYQEPHWPVPVYKDASPGVPVKTLTEPSLTCVFTPSNDGSSSTVTASVTNHLVRDFKHVSIEFTMPVPANGKTYSVTGGSVNDVYDTDEHQIWYVTAGVEAEASAQVTITEVDQ